MTSNVLVVVVPFCVTLMAIVSWAILLPAASLATWICQPGTVNSKVVEFSVIVWWAMLPPVAICETSTSQLLLESVNWFPETDVGAVSAAPPHCCRERWPDP